MTKLSIVLLQIDVSFGNPKKNRENIRRWFERAELKPNELVLLPELWDTGYDLTRLSEIADRDGETAQLFLSQLAKEYQVYISGGSIARQSDDKFFNTTYIVTPTGSIQVSYDKVHLFRLMQEEKFLHAGSQLVQTTILGVPLSPFICYDLRFPEFLRKSANQKTELFLFSAQWPTVRIDHWKKLLQARAIENQCFVAAVNRVGEDPDNKFGGNSMIVDPLGNILLELDDSEGFGRKEINMQEVSDVRKGFPVFEDRRTNLYY